MQPRRGLRRLGRWVHAEERLEPSRAKQAEHVTVATPDVHDLCRSVMENWSQTANELAMRVQQPIRCAALLCEILVLGGVTVVRVEDLLGRDAIRVHRSARTAHHHVVPCLLYTSDAADDLLCVDLGGRR